MRKILSIVFFAALWLNPMANFAQQQQNQQQRKNILVIFVDDLKPTVHAFGDDFAITPEMDKLASGGYVFDRNYVQQAVCAPSRASILTGWRPDRTQVWDLKTLIRKKNPNVVTMPQWFKQHGYTTYATGKIFDPRSVDKHHDKISWSVPYVAPYELPGSMGEPVLGYYQSDEHRMQFQVYEKMADAKGLSGAKRGKFLRSNFKPSTEKADVPDDAYFDGRIANDAMAKLDQFSKSGKPFMLFVGFKKPHLPFVAPSKYWDMYDPKKIQLAKYQKHSKGGPSIAYHNNGELRSYTDIPAAFDANGLLDPDKQRELIHGYYAATSYIDAQIGKVIKKLEEDGLAENTIIVLWGDHGWHLGDHGLWCKHTNFEQATRSPFMIIDPSKKPGKTRIPVESLDLFPTLCELAGIPAEPTSQGISLVPLLDGKDIEKHYAVSQWPKHSINGMGYTIRTERYRYTEWYQNYVSTDKRNDKDIVATEFYDYEEDPLETHNLVKNKKYAEVVAQHREMLHKFLDSQELSGKPSVTAGGDEIPGKPKGTPLRQLVAENFSPDSVFIGCTFAYNYFNSDAANLLASQFSYTVPENAVKQSYVHPEAGIWRWDKIDRILKFAKKNDMVVRLHGPVSPQASNWAKTDSRKPEELLQNMTEYLTEQCKRYNDNPVVKWMDVVNETVDQGGKWFGPKPGVDKWENPWLKIGLNKDGYPIYIVKAFEIANKYAPNVKLVFNQHLDMEPAVWEKVKETVLYLRKRGLRVDGIGWQAHLKSDEPLAFSEKDLKYLGELIDWCHANNLEFHVTEIDYRINAPMVNDVELEKQADAYANILKVLLSKRHSGVVTYNTWGLMDSDDSEHHDKARFIFDKDLKAKPAYYAIQSVLEHPDDLEAVIHRKSVVDDGKNLIQNAGFEKGKKPWISFGTVSIENGIHQRSGNKCLKIDEDKSGIKQSVKVKPNTDYVLTAWIKSGNNEKVRLKVKAEKDIAGKTTSAGHYTKVTVEFNSGNNTEISVACTKWNSGNSPAWVDDFYLIEK